MGIEKQGSKGGNYVGGFLQLFDWNAKSRKKLFSSKSDLPEKSKQKKRFDGTLPTTRLQMMDEDEISVGSSIKGSIDHSCASSVTDEDFYGSKCPGVVARLMGLDSLPKPNTPDFYSTPVYDSQSLPGSYYKTENLDYSQDQKYQKVVQRPIEKFQTEILPPRSAKSIPITQNKLLSPIKSVNFVKDAAEIMEAAARIIEPGNQSSRKTKPPLVGSSSAPLKVKDLKEKAQSAQKPIKMSQESSGVTGHLRNKSWNGGSSVRIFQDSEESSSGVKSKGKSISLALQAKANVKKREALRNELGTNMLFISETKKSSTVKKPSENSSKPLRQNNQKQNCSNDRGKLPLKSNLQKDDKRHVMNSSSERTRKRRSTDGNYHKSQTGQSIRKGKNGKVVQASATKDTRSSGDKDGGKKGTEVISFTFTAPMRSSEVLEDCKIFRNSPSKRITVNVDGVASSKLSFLGQNGKGGDALSTFLEQQLKELAHKVEISQHNMKNGNYSVNQELYFPSDAQGFITGQKFQNVVDEKGIRGRSIPEERTFLKYQLPSPVSVLEHSLFIESCNSSDSAESNHSIGSGNKYSLMKTPLSSEGDAESTDSASSTSSRTLAKKQVTTWELKYVKKMLCNIDQMFDDYATGRAGQIVDPHLFYQLESRNNCGPCPRTDRRLLFDCVGECLDRRCRKYAVGGCKMWGKGVRVVREKDRLGEDVYRQISDWSAMGDFMVDELVESDMSCGLYGRWLDYDVEGFEIVLKIEGRILSALIDEVVGDILVL